jgi:hypothetical protein
MVAMSGAATNGTKVLAVLNWPHARSGRHKRRKVSVTQGGEARIHTELKPIVVELGEVGVQAPTP